MPLDITLVREQFPALRNPAVFFDNPGSTQIVGQVLDRMTTYLTEYNTNHGGAFATSRKSDAVLDEARTAAADFLNASRPEEVVFGPNMTSLTFNLNRSLARWLDPGDEIVVTRLDHDANIAPWTLAAEERGCTIRWVDFDVEDGTLRLDTLEAALEHEPKIVAIGYASNALGTINPIARIVDMAHAAGALVYVDAVQYAPHGPIDVQQLGCDFLSASAYKFFGPHVSILYGRYELLDKLMAYKVRPAHDSPPDKFETGTKNHEGIAGILGAFEYLEWVGDTFGDLYAEKYASRHSGRRLRLKQAMTAIRAYEFEISRALLEILTNTPGVHLYGPCDPRRLEERVPTFSFTVAGQHPRQVAEKLGKEYLRLGRELLCPGRHRASGSRRKRRHGAGRRGALQHIGRSQPIRRSSIENCQERVTPSKTERPHNFQGGRLNDKCQSEGGTLTFVPLIIPNNPKFIKGISLQFHSKIRGS